MKPKTSLRSFLFLAGGSLLAISSASAVNWTQTASGIQQWNTGGNWDAAAPNAIGAVANLSLNLANTQTVNLASGVTLGSLTFGDTATTFFAQTITGSAITFDNSGSGATLTQAGAATGAPGNISNNIVLNDNLTLVNNGTSTDHRTNGTQLTGAISGTGGITLNTGGGNGFALTNTGNTYSGGLTLNAANAGVVTGSNNNAFGTGTITINAGKIDISSSGSASQAITTTNANVWNGNWTLAGAVSTGIWNNNGSVTLGGNVTVTGGSNANLSLGGNIGQTGTLRSLTLNGGVNTLSGTNSYTGGTSVGSFGTLNFINTASMPSTGAVTFAANTTLGIGLGGNGWTSTGTGAGTLAGIFQGTNVGVGTGGVALTYGTSVGLNLIVTGNHSFGAIENLGSSATAFTKAGIGSLTITGDNIYTGATSVIGGGALVLDYNSGNVTKFTNTPAALTLGAASAGTSLNQGTGGGTITLKAGAQTETVSATTLNFGGTFITRDTGTSKINFNAIARLAGGTISFADATIATTDTNNFGASGVNGILGGWATVGNNWAVSANTGAADTAITALGSYTPYVNTGGVATTNYSLSGSNTVAAGGNAVGTLKITDTGAGQSLALGDNNLTITSTSATALGGLMYAGGTNGNYEISGGLGRISTSTAGQEIIFAVQSGNLTVSALIGGSGSANSVTKSGAGTMIISRGSSYTGALRVNEGVVRLTTASAAGANQGGIVVQNGAALELSGGITVGSLENLFLTGSGISNGGALRNVSGANNYQAVVTLGIGGARINNDAAGALTLTGGLATNIAGNVTFGGVGNTTVQTVGIIGGGGLTKDGTGTLTLSATNSYIGATTVSDGKLLINGSTSSTSLVSVAAAGTLGGSGTVGGHTTISGTHSPGNSPGLITHSGNLTYEAGANVLWELVANSVGSRGTNFDGINVGATLDFNGATTLNLNFNFGASAVEWSDTFWATSYTGTGGWLVYSGATTLTDFGNLSLNAPSAWLDETGDTLASARSGSSFGLFQDGNNIYLNYSAVPEPRAALLGGLGMLMLLRRRRARTRSGGL